MNDPAQDDKFKNLVDDILKTSDTPSEVDHQSTNPKSSYPDNRPISVREPTPQEKITISEPNTYQTLEKNQNLENEPLESTESEENFSPKIYETSQEETDHIHQTNLDNLTNQALKELASDHFQETNINSISSLDQPKEDQTIENTKKPKKPILLTLVLLSLFSVIILSLSGLFYAIAYEKIKLEKYPDFQKKVSLFVMNISFMPKTPRFILEKSAIAHQKVTKQSFDVSVAVDSSNLSNYFGFADLDFQFKGDLDYTNPKNIFGNLEIFFTKDFNIELRKKDKMLYFKIKKLPTTLFAFLGLDSKSFDPIIDKWVFIDTTPLDTEARKSLEKDTEMSPLSEKFLDENFDKYFDDVILSKIKLTSSKDEELDVYKISLEADSQLIDYLGKKIEDMQKQKYNYSYPKNSTANIEKISDIIKKFNLEIAIDKEKYFTRKIVTQIDIEYDESKNTNLLPIENFLGPLSSSNNQVSVATVIKFSNFGEEVIVEEPQETMSSEEFSNRISLIFGKIIGEGYQKQISQSNDAKRKSDLQQLESALEIYFLVNQKYPSSLSDLNPNYIFIIPKDPDGSDYYYIQTNDGNSYNLCAKLDNPLLSNSSCTNPFYNYSITPNRE